MKGNIMETNDITDRNGSENHVKDENLKKELRQTRESEKIDDPAMILKEETEEVLDDKTEVTQINVFENCPICNKLLNTNHMDKHVKDVHIDPNIPCEWEGCDKMFKTEDIMKGHVSRFHEMMRREICSSCNKEFHPSSHRMNKCKDPFICEICKKQFSSNSSLKNHIKKFHEDPELCPHCGIEVKDLSSHMNAKHTDKAFKMSTKEPEREQCQECFKWLIDLSNHMKIVHREKQFTCDECGQLFGRNLDLESHRERIHLGLRYMCPECGKAVCKLKDHMRKVHQTQFEATDIEKYRVTIDLTPKEQIKLELSDYEEFDLKVFAMMEWKENIWTCVTCGKFESKNKFNVRNHIEAKHFEGVIHPCSECGKYFSTRNVVNNHKSTQHKKRKFSEEL